MTEHIDINHQNWDERAVIHARDVTGGYMLDRFRAGEDSLHAIESAELGDISGKRVLHLQCHIGRDTLCLARRGAAVTGLDFSGAALGIARRLSEETGIPADFVQGTVEQAADLTPGPFDLVFTTWGTICWLPDMAIWAKVITAVLVPGASSILPMPIQRLRCWKSPTEVWCRRTISKPPLTDRCGSLTRRRTLATRPSCLISQPVSGFIRCQRCSAG